MKKVINIGGNKKSIPLPREFEGWEHVLLDIDPKVKPDIICDARDLKSLNAKEYDAVYCSHNLEHYFRHDVPKVLTGFSHLLVDGGFVYITVPNLDALMRTVIEKDIDIDDFLYQSEEGPITARDVIYGYGVEIERSGCDYFAHKTGFTPKSLRKILNQCGFPIVYTVKEDLEVVYTVKEDLEVRAIGLMDEPTIYVKKLFKIS